MAIRTGESCARRSASPRLSRATAANEVNSARAPRLARSRCAPGRVVACPPGNSPRSQRNTTSEHREQRTEEDDLAERHVVAHRLHADEHPGHQQARQQPQTDPSALLRCGVHLPSTVAAAGRAERHPEPVRIELAQRDRAPALGTGHRGWQC